MDGKKQNGLSCGNGKECAENRSEKADAAAFRNAPDVTPSEQKTECGAAPQSADTAAESGVQECVRSVSEEATLQSAETHTQDAAEKSAEGTSISQETAEKTAEGAKDAPKGGENVPDAAKQRRRGRWGLIVVLVILGAVIYALWKLSDTIQQGDTATFYEMLDGMNWWFILLTYALFFVMFIMEALKFTLLGKCNGCSLGFKADMKSALVGKYYECLTPFASGGQPMQIYHLHQKGLSSAMSASITMVKYGVHMLGFTFVAAIVMGFGASSLGNLIGNEASRNVILICGWIGFGINAFIPLFVTFVTFFPKPVAWCVNLGVKLLHKIRIIRNADKIEAKVRNWVADFSIFSQFLYKKPLAFFLLFLLCLGEPVLELIFPYLIMLAMMGGNVAGMQGWELFFAVVVLAMYATYAATFIPTPGNSGAIEMVFMAAFATITQSVLFWYVLAWRFVLYYTWIMLGLGMNITDLAGQIRARRKERLKNCPRS